MSVEFTVVSIGAMSSNPFWKEPPGVRTPHATTTLVRDGQRLILVDPSLPGQILLQRLNERTGLTADDITDVFCTTLRPTHRRGIEAFSTARWLAFDEELQVYRGHLAAMAEASHRAKDDLHQAIHAEERIVERFEACPERITEAVHLFPLKGPSAGSAGLLLAGSTRTVVVAGDAALTSDHVLAGRVWSGAADTQQAMDSLTEILEIADVIVCGHDNYMLCPGR
jgi:glyoxylase-like metal-dependent hydrolase (beta-lactamase superfamily II)